MCDLFIFFCWSFRELCGKKSVLQHEITVFVCLIGNP